MKEIQGSYFQLVVLTMDGKEITWFYSICHCKQNDMINHLQNVAYIKSLNKQSH